jgi:hypothetical protein
MDDLAWRPAPPVVAEAPAAPPSDAPPGAGAGAGAALVPVPLLPPAISVEESSRP